jgi:hypothetical protein
MLLRNGAAKKIQELSESGMESLKPNTIVYNCVLNGSALVEWHEAEGILNEMKSLSAEASCPGCCDDIVWRRAFASKLPGTGPRAEKVRETSERHVEGSPDEARYPFGQLSHHRLCQRRPFQSRGR